jgi:hypothetical protein
MIPAHTSFPTSIHSVTILFGSNKQIGEDEDANTFSSRFHFECKHTHRTTKPYHLDPTCVLNTKPKQSNYLFHRNRGSLTSIW